MQGSTLLGLSLSAFHVMKIFVLWGKSVWQVIFVLQILSPLFPINLLSERIVFAVTVHSVMSVSNLVLLCNTIL